MIERQFCIAVGLLLAGSQGIAQEPVDVLKTNGLVKSGKFFVYPEEEKVLQGLFNMRPVMSQLETKYEKARQPSPLCDQRCGGGPMNRESGEGRMSLGTAHPSPGAGSSSCQVPLECFPSSFLVDPISSGHSCPTR